jgi:CubicO group peptidase (beta-lactamase class C family)
MRRDVAIVWLLCAVTGTSVAAPTPNFSCNPASAAVQSHLDSRFTQMMQTLNVPGLATVVVRDGSLRWLQTYGVLDRSKPESLAISKVVTSTTFRVA